MSLQLPLGITLPDSATFDNFYSGRNGAAVATVQACARGQESAVSLHGSASCGKTHLLHAACRLASELGQRSVYLPLAELKRHGPDCLEGMADYPLVCLDDIDRVLGDASWEHGLFNLLNELRLNKRHYLIAARDTVAAMSIDLPDLRSRLQWGAPFVLQMLNDEERKQVLQQRARQRGLELPDDSADYLMRRAPRELSQLMRVLEQLDQASLAAQRRLTIPFLRDTLGL